MATMHHLLFIVWLCLSIENIHSEVVFDGLCSTEVRATGLVSMDGNDEFEIELYEGKFLPDDTITCKRKKYLRIYLKKLICIFKCHSNRNVKIMVLVNLLYVHLIMMILLLAILMINKQEI